MVISMMKRLMSIATRTYRMQKLKYRLMKARFRLQWPKYQLQKANIKWQNKITFERASLQSRLRLSYAEQQIL
jgi:hypothetical protein